MQLERVHAQHTKQWMEIGVIDVVYMLFRNSIKVQQKNEKVSPPSVHIEFTIYFEFGGLYVLSIRVHVIRDHQEFHWVNYIFQDRRLLLVLLSALLPPLLALSLLLLWLFFLSCPTTASMFLNSIIKSN